MEDIHVKNDENIKNDNNYDEFNCLLEQIAMNKLVSFDNNIFFVGDETNRLTSITSKFNHNDVDDRETFNEMKENNFNKK